MLTMAMLLPNQQPNKSSLLQLSIPSRLPSACFGQRPCLVMFARLESGLVLRSDDSDASRPMVGASGSHGTGPSEPLRDHYYSSDLHRMHTKPDGSRSDDRDRQYGNNNRGSNSGGQDSYRYFETASEPRPSITPRQQEPFASRLIPTMVVIEAGISTTAEPRGEEIRTAFSMHPTARPML